MAKNIVFLNLADMHPAGLAKTSIQSLQKKYKRYNFLYELVWGANQIYQVDLFEMLKGRPNGSGVPLLPWNALSDHTRMALSRLPEDEANFMRERLEISILCRNADKIMLGAHGRAGTTDTAYAGLGWEKGDGVIGSPEQFATLVSSFLLPVKSYKIALIVCFGARSADHKKNHDGDLTTSDIKSSFAYRFFKGLCKKVDVTLTASTGSVGFNDYTGRSEVQTEAAATAEIDHDELQQAKKTKALTDAYEELFNQYGESGRIRRFRELEVFASGNQPEEEIVFKDGQERKDFRVIKEYLPIRNLTNALKNQSLKMQTKHGKFVYTYQQDEVTVYRKYEEGKKVMTVLYKGKL